MFTRLQTVSLLILCLALCGCASNTGDSAKNRLRIGPFFEYRENTDGSVFTAVRPFWSRSADPSNAVYRQDFIWPIGTWSSDKGDGWWRVLAAYGDFRANDPSWSANLFPLWFSGADRSGRKYWGLFPVYGTHSHILFMDDVEWILFPVYLRYRNRSTHRYSVLFPFFSFSDDDYSFGCFPLFSRLRAAGADNKYALWPVATWADHTERRDTAGAGTSWMVWPLYGRVDRKRESQQLYLPPFFSYSETPVARRWRLPWPFFEYLSSERRDRLSVWPFYEAAEGYELAKNARRKPGAGPEQIVRRYLWYLVEDVEIKDSRTSETRFTVFPFWTSEKRSRRDADGSFTEVSSYKRFWPFWASRTDQGLNSQRVLELNPIRHAPGIERNWASFWTLWDCEDLKDGRTLHTLFWGLVKFHTGNKNK